MGVISQHGRLGGIAEGGLKLVERSPHARAWARERERYRRLSLDEIRGLLAEMLQDHDERSPNEA